MDNPFESGTSFLHGLDPRIRIMCAVFLSFAAALSHYPQVAGAYLILGMGLVRLGRISWQNLKPRVKPLLWFLVMIWIFLPLTFSQEIIANIGGLNLSMAGIRLSIMITLKSLAIVLMFTALIATMPMASLGKAMHQLHVPDKLVFLLLMTYRYVFVIQEEYLRLLRAARFRGFSPGTNLHSYRTYAYLAGMLFVRASMRARRVHQAMLCRGFDRRFYTLDVYSPNRWNLLFFIAMLGAGFGITLIDMLWMYS
jgi:cobalt/nickel transport system permease protein